MYVFSLFFEVCYFAPYQHCSITPYQHTKLSALHPISLSAHDNCHICGTSSSINPQEENLKVLHEAKVLQVYFRRNIQTDSFRDKVFFAGIFRVTRPKRHNFATIFILHLTGNLVNTGDTA